MKCVCEMNSFGRMINPLCHHHLELIERVKDPQTKKGLISARNLKLKESQKTLSSEYPTEDNND